MSFYGEMADMARELLASEADGGLGQGVITVERIEQEPMPPDWPTWEPWEGAITIKTYLLRGAVSGISKELVDGTTILASDQMLICADWMALISTQTGDDEPVTSNAEVLFDLKVGDIVQIDGKPVTTMQKIAIPGAGIVAAHKFIVRA